MDPQDKRELERIMSGLWDELDSRFENELSLSSKCAADAASAAEIAVRAVLVAYFKKENV